MKADGIDAAKKFFHDTNADTVERKYYLWCEDDGAIEYPGYIYLEHDMYPEAIELFKFNSRAVSKLWLGVLSPGSRLY